MKKVILIVLSIAICFSICACDGKNSKSKEEPYLNVKQKLVNICCAYSNCYELDMFEIGSKSEKTVDGVRKVSASGSYYPVDKYGDSGAKMLFDIEFTAELNEEKSDYRITVTKTEIKPKY